MKQIQNGTGVAQSNATLFAVILDRLMQMPEWQSATEFTNAQKKNANEEFNNIRAFSHFDSFHIHKLRETL